MFDRQTDRQKDRQKGLHDTMHCITCSPTVKTTANNALNRKITDNRQYRFCFFLYFFYSEYVLMDSSLCACNILPGKTNLQHDVLMWDIKLYRVAH